MPDQEHLNLNKPKCLFNSQFCFCTKIDYSVAIVELVSLAFAIFIFFHFYTIFKDSTHFTETSLSTLLMIHIFQRLFSIAILVLIFKCNLVPKLMILTINCFIGYALLLGLIVMFNIKSSIQIVDKNSQGNEEQKLKDDKIRLDLQPLIYQVSALLILWTFMIPFFICKFKREIRQNQVNSVANSKCLTIENVIQQHQRQILTSDDHKGFEHCKICYSLDSPMKKSNGVITLPCKPNYHQFHSICLLRWLKKAKNIKCPTCQQNSFAQLMNDEISVDVYDPSRDASSFPSVSTSTVKPIEQEKIIENKVSTQQDPGILNCQL